MRSYYHQLIIGGIITNVAEIYKLVEIMTFSIKSKLWTGDCFFKAIRFFPYILILDHNEDLLNNTRKIFLVISNQIQNSSSVQIQ